MSKRNLTAVVVLAAVIVLAIILFQTGPENGEPETSTIRVGAILPLTGPAAQYGKYCRDGITLGVEEVTSSDVLKGKHIKIIFEDSKADPKEAVTSAKKLITVDKVPAILCLTTGDTSAIAPICEESQTVLITGTVAPGAADKGDYIFRNAANLSADAEKMAEFCVNKLGIRRVAVIALNIDALVSVEKVFRSKLESLGAQVTKVEYGDKGDTDFRTQITKVKETNPEAVYLLGYIEVAYMLKQSRELGFDAQFLGDPSMESPKVIEIAGQAAEGVIYSRAAFDIEDPRPEIRNFRDEYANRYGQSPEVFAAQFYDDIRILAQVISSSGSSSDEIRAGLLGIKDFPGVSGIITFLSNGDVSKPIEFKMIKDGNFISYQK